MHTYNKCLVYFYVSRLEPILSLRLFLQRVPSPVFVNVEDKPVPLFVVSGQHILRLLNKYSFMFYLTLRSALKRTYLQMFRKIMQTLFENVSDSHPSWQRFPIYFIDTISHFLGQYSNLLFQIYCPLQQQTSAQIGQYGRSVTIQT